MLTVAIIHGKSCFKTFKPQKYFLLAVKNLWQLILMNFKWFTVNAAYEMCWLVFFLYRLNYTSVHRASAWNCMIYLSHMSSYSTRIPNSTSVTLQPIYANRYDSFLTKKEDYHEIITALSLQRNLNQYNVFVCSGNETVNRVYFCYAPLFFATNA